MAKRKVEIPAQMQLPAIPPFDSGEWLSSGSTMLNLACAGTTLGAFYPGGFFHLPGDSDTGKTWVMMTMFAEAAKNPMYDDYLLIHDKVEHGALMDIPKFFGQKAADRIQPPPHGTSVWLEDVYYSLDDLAKAGKPFIYVLDSLDGVSCEADEERQAEDKETRRQGKRSKGAYKVDKARLNSAHLRTVSCQSLIDTRSILFFVSQTRENFGGGMFGPAKRYAGGDSLRFHTRAQMWFAAGKALKKTFRGKDHHVGITCKVRVKKNHIHGRRVDVEFPIYTSYGIDDIGSCIDWLLSNSTTWLRAGQSIVAPDFDFKGTKANLISTIEDGGRQNELKMVVREVWQEIEDGIKQNRPGRYS